MLMNRVFASSASAEIPGSRGFPGEGASNEVGPMSSRASQSLTLCYAKRLAFTNDNESQLIRHVSSSSWVSRTLYLQLLS